MSKIEDMPQRWPVMMKLVSMTFVTLITFMGFVGAYAVIFQSFPWPMTFLNPSPPISYQTYLEQQQTYQQGQKSGIIVLGLFFMLTAVWVGTTRLMRMRRKEVKETSEPRRETT